MLLEMEGDHVCGIIGGGIVMRQVLDAQWHHVSCLKIGTKGMVLNDILDGILKFKKFS